MNAVHLPVIRSKSWSDKYPKSIGQLVKLTGR